MGKETDNYRYIKKPHKLIILSKCSIRKGIKILSHKSELLKELKGPKGDIGSVYQLLIVYLFNHGARPKCASK